MSENDLVLDGLFRGKRLHTFAPPEAAAVETRAEAEHEETRSGAPDRLRNRIDDPEAPEPPPKHA